MTRNLMKQNSKNSSFILNSSKHDSSSSNDEEEEDDTFDFMKTRGKNLPKSVSNSINTSLEQKKKLNSSHVSISERMAAQKKAQEMK
jgi:hypothetical protein